MLLGEKFIPKMLKDNTNRFSQNAHEVLQAYLLSLTFNISICLRTNPLTCNRNGDGCTSPCHGDVAFTTNLSAWQSLVNSYV